MKTEAAKLFTLGLEHLGQQRLEEAEAAFQEAVRLDDSLAAAYNNLGLIQLGKGWIDGAIAAFTEALKKDPRMAMAYNNMAAVLHGNGDLKRAEALYLKAVQVAPDEPDAFYNLSLLYINHNRFEEARPLLEKVVRIAPGHGPSYYLLGLAYLETQDLYGAIANFQLAKSQAPELSEARVGLSEAYRRQGKYDLAVEELTQLAEEKPDEAAIAVRCALIGLEIENYDFARFHLERALKLKTDDPSVHELYALLLAGAGSREEAMEAARQAIALAPDDEQLKETLVQIEAGLIKPV